MNRNRHNNLSLLFAAAAILSVAGSVMQPAKYDNFSFAIYSLFFSTSFSILLTATGYFIQAGMSCDTKKKSKSILLPLLAACALSVGITAFIFFFIQISGKNANLVHILRELVLLPTKGFPAQLWIIPVVIAAVSVILLLRKSLSLKKITAIAAVIYLISTFILNFSLLFPDELYSVRKLFSSLFGYNHSGVFSGMLFIALGMQLAEKRIYRKKSAYLLGTVASAVFLIAEMLLIKEYGGNRNSYFCISSVFFAYNLTVFTALCPSIGFFNENLLKEFGKSFFLAGQILTGARIFLKSYPASIFAKFFITEAKSIEFILFFSLCISLFYCANKCNNEDITRVFIHLLQKAVLTVFYLPSVISSKINGNLKNIVCISAFAALPLLLWFIERQINHSLCCDLFFICLVIILFCSLDKRLSPSRVSAGFFTGFFILATALYLTSTIYSVPGYTDIGRMMLFFFLPLGIEIAGSKERIAQLLKNYTYGLYISYGIFFFYCACFRPYDITRYKGAFCNANMCGLYLVAVCLTALCNLPRINGIKDILKQPLHWFVFGTSFAFTAFTISRTAALGVAAALAVKFISEYFCIGQIRTINRNTAKKALSAISLLIIIMTGGLIISYTAIRCIPAIVDNPIFLLVEYTDTYEYKVKPGESFFSENYISPIRFFEAWLNRSFSSADNINDLSTGRIDIYAQYLKSITIQGHSALRIPISATGEFMYAHNAFLQLAYNCGLPVGLGFAVFCAAAVFRALKKSITDKKFIIFGAVAVAAYFSCGMFESMECFYYPLLFSALTGFMLLAVSPAEKDTDIDISIADKEKSSDTVVSATEKIDILLIKKIILCTVTVILFAIFIYFLFESKNSQEGMKIFYQYMQ